MSVGYAGAESAGVGGSALGAAMVRAMESRRGDRLFHDPYAALFLAAAPGRSDPAHRGAVAVSGLSRTGASFWKRVVLRTRYFDDVLLEAAGRGLRQVVLLAAGLDMRAYRLDWPPGVCVYELDLPGVLRYKRRVLRARVPQPRCELHRVPADLRDDWPSALLAAGYEPGRPAAWLLEGLLIYLSADEVERVLGAVGSLACRDSVVAFEDDGAAGADGGSVVEDLRAEARRLPAAAPYARLWQGGMAGAPAWLAGHGWRVEPHTQAAVAARHGRGGAPSGGYIVGTRA
ncbi:MAG TPA: SAM-dependent methyltransferase [Actinocrinis sp.]|nr:SAM-dependent methyltransferase [Actinocrinis sp.]